jgi:hypothetical protein
MIPGFDTTGMTDTALTGVFCFCSFSQFSKAEATEAKLCTRRWFLWEVESFPLHKGRYKGDIVLLSASGHTHMDISTWLGRC